MLGIKPFGGRMVLRIVSTSELVWDWYELEEVESRFWKSWRRWYISYLIYCTTIIPWLVPISRQITFGLLYCTKENEHDSGSSFIFSGFFFINQINNFLVILINLFIAMIKNKLKEASLPLKLYFQIIHQNSFTFKNRYLNKTKQQLVLVVNKTWI